ncbi:hypothetical protein HMPREF1139_1321 [Campylobacter sp. FOBRC14]|nr:hypothetical protein HMPREF1139_1321 [Campylobacter sp. FOBRC14]
MIFYGILLSLRKNKVKICLNIKFNFYILYFEIKTIKKEDF